MSESFTWHMGNEKDRNLLLSLSRSEGEKVAEAQYPYLVQRNIPDIVAIARNIANKELEAGSSTFTTDKEAYRDTFINSYTKGYFDRVEALDKKAGITPTTPAANPTNKATLQGATVTLQSVDRTLDEDLYIIELVDPGHLDEPQLVYVHVGDGEPQQAAASGQALAGSFSSAYGAVASSSSQPDYGRSDTSKVQHVYLKRKR